MKESLNPDRIKGESTTKSFSQKTSINEIVQEDLIKEENFSELSSKILRIKDSPIESQSHPLSGEIEPKDGIKEKSPNIRAEFSKRIFLMLLEWVRSFSSGEFSPFGLALKDIACY